MDVLSHLKELESVPYTVGNVWKPNFHTIWNHLKIQPIAPVMIKKKSSERSNCRNLVFFSQSLCNDLGSTLLFNIFLKSTLAHVSWRSPLKAFLNLLALSIVTRPTGTFNGSFGAWIASHLHMIYNPFYLSQLMPCYFSVFFPQIGCITDFPHTLHPFN